MLCDIAATGFAHAEKVIETMVGMQVSVNAPITGKVPIRDIPFLVGSPEVPVVAGYVRISGEIQGHALLLFTWKSTLRMLWLMLALNISASAEPRLESLGNMGESALAEVTNVTISSLLNTLSDSADMKITVSPPIVVCDMAGSLLETVLADLSLYSDEVYLLKTGFCLHSQDVMGYLFIIPYEDSYRKISSAVEDK